MVTAWCSSLVTTVDRQSGAVFVGILENHATYQRTNVLLPERGSSLCLLYLLVAGGYDFPSSPVTSLQKRLCAAPVALSRSFAVIPANRFLRFSGLP